MFATPAGFVEIFHAPVPRWLNGWYATHAITCGIAAALVVGAAVLGCVSVAGEAGRCAGFQRRDPHITISKGVGRSNGARFRHSSGAQYPAVS